MDSCLLKYHKNQEGAYTACDIILNDTATIFAASYLGANLIDTYYLFYKKFSNLILY